MLYITGMYDIYGIYIMIYWVCYIIYAIYNCGRAPIFYKGSTQRKLALTTGRSGRIGRALVSHVGKSWVQTPIESNQWLIKFILAAS